MSCLSQQNPLQLGRQATTTCQPLHTLCSHAPPLHRRADLKGGNVLLKTADTRRGYQAKVADFGTARALGRQQRVQSEKYGTVTHCPPELLLEGTFSKVHKQAQRGCGHFPSLGVVMCPGGV
jgi:hypothetical protein